jgi:hypothetical protein
MCIQSVLCVLHGGLSYEGRRHKGSDDATPLLWRAIHHCARRARRRSESASLPATLPTSNRDEMSEEHERPPFVVFGYGSLIFKVLPDCIARSSALMSELAAPQHNRAR